MTRERQRRKDRLAAGCGLVVLTLLLNANALTAFFVGDDYDLLLKTTRMDGVADAFRFGFWGEWEPVWYLSWYLDYQLWGLRPLGFHLTNVLWLAIGVVALYGFVRTVWPEAPLAAWAAALLFAVYPLHDEAVTYLTARGHVMAVSLSAVTLWLYALARESGSPSTPRSRRIGLLAGALGAAFLAALAKEVAVTLPAWIGICEWVLPSRGRSRSQALRAGIVAGLLFLVPAGASLGLRHFVVGLGSDKLSGVLEEEGAVQERFERLLEELPAYALLGGLPVPFALSDYPTLEKLQPLGWLLLIAGVLGGSFALYLCALRRSRAPAPVAAVVFLGLVIAGTSLLPVFWAHLPLRRRYLCTPSLGLVLLVAALLWALARRYPRAGLAALVIVTASGAVMSVHRNELYRRSGEVARELIEAVRQAPVGEPPRVSGSSSQVVLVTLPRAYGGDFVSGAYLLHHSDLASALSLYGVPQRRIEYALKFYYADDHTAEIVPGGAAGPLLRVSFRSRRAYEDARARDASDDHRGQSLRATLQSADPEARVLTYRLHAQVPRGTDVLLYSAGRFTRVAL